MSVWIDFQGYTHNPISYNVRIFCSRAERGFVGKAVWQMEYGSCGVEISLVDDKVTVTDFRARERDFQNRLLIERIQELGLNASEISYIEGLFREAVQVLVRNARFQASEPITRGWIRWLDYRLSKEFSGSHAFGWQDPQGELTVLFKSPSPWCECELHVGNDGYSFVIISQRGDITRLKEFLESEGFHFLEGSESAVV